MVTFLKLICSVNVKARQNVPSWARLAAGAFGFLTLIQVFDGPERYGAFSFFDTMPSRPSWQTASSILSLIVKTFALMERRTRRLSRHRTARYRPKSRCPETAGSVRRHGRCAGQPLRSPAYTRRGRQGRPTVPGNRPRNIHRRSRFGRRLLRGRTGCFRNGPGWSEPPRSSFRRTEMHLQTEWNRWLRKRPPERWHRCDCRSWESSCFRSRGRLLGDGWLAPMNEGGGGI